MNEKSQDKLPLKTRISRAFIPQTEIPKKAYFIIGACAFFLILAIWSYLSFGGITSPQFLPNPIKTIESAIKLFTKQDFISDIWITMVRVLAGFLIAAVVSVPLGLLMGTYAPIQSFIEPLMSFIRYLPVTAFIPLFILWIGIGESEKVAVIIMGSLPQLILMVATDTKKVQHDLVEVSYTLGTTKANVLWKIILPAALPHIMDSLRMVLGWAWTYVTVAEMIGASSGIGYMIISSQRMLNVGNIFTGILTIGIIGLLFDCLFTGLTKLLFPWR